MEIRFRPLDPVFFRNGRPFASGEESWADSIFPPNPSVLYGALRTVLATVSGKEILFADVKAKLDKNSLQVGRLYYFLENQVYFPLPLDYVVDKVKSEEARQKEKETKRFSVYLSKSETRKSVIPQSKDEFLKYILLAPSHHSQTATPEGAIISDDSLLEYLQREAKELSARKLSDYFTEEPKVGNGRTNQTRSVEESLLYRVGMQRLKDVTLGMNLRIAKGYDQKDIDGAQVRLGGEGKIAVLQGVPDSNFQERIGQIQLNPGFFKLYFATPAIIDNDTNMPNLGIQAELVAASIGKPMSIGGYDMIENKAKMMYKAIPAGSVFYYKTSEKPETIQAMQGQSFSDRRQEEGFGIAYFGNFTPSTHSV